MTLALPAQSDHAAVHRDVTAWDEEEQSGMPRSTLLHGQMERTWRWLVGNSSGVARASRRALAR